MNAFRKWSIVALPAIAVALATAIVLSAKGNSNSHASKDWLLWLVLTTPLYTLGARSRPCRRPRWLGGR